MVGIALGPNTDELLVEAVARGGGVVAGLSEARGLVWDAGPDGFPDPLPDNIEWVQLYAAGVEDFFTTGVIPRHENVVFTSAAGAFAASVAEHALALLLAGVRAVPEHLRAETWRQQKMFDTIGTLRGSKVTIVGAGGIGRILITMLRPLGADLVFKMPVVSSLARKSGATLACVEDAERMLAGGAG